MVAEAACPYGSYDRRVLAALRKHRFSRVYTVDRRPARAGSWLQGRYAVRRTDTPETLEQFGRESLMVSAVRAAKSLVKRWR